MRGISRRELLGLGSWGAVAVLLPGCGEPYDPLPQGGPGFVPGGPLPWRNWAGTQGCIPAERVAPTSEDEVVRFMARSIEPVRPVGAGHSFSGLVPTDRALLSLDSLAGVLSVDPVGGDAEVWAGTRLTRLGPALAAQGRALANLPDIAYPALGGAIATSTHGTGVRFGSLSSMVTRLVLVTPTGERLECSAEHNPDLFRAAQTHLGALGVVTRVGLRTVPAWNALERSEFVDLEPLLTEAPRLAQAHRHFEFYAFPHASVALQITTHETTVEPYQTAVDDPEGLAGVRALATTLVRLGPPGRAILDWILRDIPAAEKAGPSYDVLAHTRTLRFHEMEYTVPADAGPACLREILATIRNERIPVVFPIEYRYVRADEAWLSMFAGRDGCSISIHQFHDVDYEPYFAAIEPIFWKYEGRPHWGKLHTLGADALARLYPRWSDFAEVRRALDPRGRMLNDHLRHVLGA